MASEKKSEFEVKNPTESAQPPQVQAQQRVVEADQLEAFYTNFARVTGSPEELILDFGMNPQPFGSPNQEITVSRRVVMNYYTAKRLLGALSMAVQRHEQAFGALETDVNKRIARR